MMAWPTSLQVGLKEWAVVCRALETGRQIILLRKGGIYESGGEFELENQEFFLFPTYLHQKAEMLKAGDQEHLEKREREPAEIILRAAGVVSEIVELKDRAAMGR